METTSELSAERRRQILKATAACIVEEGIQGASLRKIARRAHATTGLITRYFPHRDELIVAAIRDLTVRLIEERGLPTAPGIERLKARFDLRFPAEESEDSAWRVFLEYWPATFRSEDLRQTYLNASRRGGNGMREDIRKGISDGRIAPDIDPDLSTDVLHALFFGLGIMHTLDPEAMPRGRVFQALEEAWTRILGGISPSLD